VTVAPEQVAEAAALGTATLYEASGLDVAMDPAIRPVWRGAALAGAAFPARCHPGDNLAIHHAMERIEPGSVLVVDCAGVLAGYWGDVLATAAQARGVAGLVIDGAVRDIDQLEAMRFPVFSRGVSILRTGKHMAGRVGAPIEVAGVLVRPGDLVVADADGVIALPAEAIAGTLQRAHARVAKEQAIKAALIEGRTSRELFALPERG
jgi:4-hydroxy-4-methyl-2-oxoglutarate aldolase